jgi:hypothetical protein
MKIDHLRNIMDKDVHNKLSPKNSPRSPTPQEVRRL